MFRLVTLIAAVAVYVSVMTPFWATVAQIVAI
jgi:hypothetical protein